MTGKLGWQVLIACAASAALTGMAGEQIAPQSGVTAQAVAETRSLTQLRKDLQRAEDRFNALYNKLNPRREEHVTCKQAADTGSRLTKRSCATDGERAAATQAALDYMAAVGDSSALAKQATGSAVPGPVETAAAAAAPGSARGYAGRVDDPEVQASTDARSNLEKLLAEHADLRKALLDYSAAHRRYEAALRSH